MSFQMSLCSFRNPVGDNVSRTAFYARSHN